MPPARPPPPPSPPNAAASSASRCALNPRPRASPAGAPPPIVKERRPLHRLLLPAFPFSGGVGRRRAGARMLGGSVRRPPPSTLSVPGRSEQRVVALQFAHLLEMARSRSAVWGFGRQPRAGRRRWSRSSRAPPPPPCWCSRLRDPSSRNDDVVAGSTLHPRASRWDLYLYMGDDQIHWFSIINSLAHDRLDVPERQLAMIDAHAAPAPTSARRRAAAARIFCRAHLGLGRGGDRLRLGELALGLRLRVRRVEQLEVEGVLALRRLLRLGRQRLVLRREHEPRPLGAADLPCALLLRLDRRLQLRRALGLAHLQLLENVGGREVLLPSLPFNLSCPASPS